MHMLCCDGNKATVANRHVTVVTYFTLNDVTYP